MKTRTIAVALAAAAGILATAAWAHEGSERGCAEGQKQERMHQRMGDKHEGNHKRMGERHGKNEAAKPKAEEHKH